MREIPAGFVLQPDGSYGKASRIAPEPRRSDLPTKTASPSLPKAPNDYSERFSAACKAAGLPAPTPEYLFAAPERRYRADFAWPDQRVMLEVEGGIWRKGGGAHSHPTNILRDMERTNEATVRGWRLLRFQPEKLTKPETMETIKRAIAWKTA